MNIDRVAKAMTGGRPRADFTARVMAPIYGRPRPGFTARVMAQTVAENATAAHAFRPAMTAALLIPAAIALLAGAVAVRASRAVLPATPDAPRLVTAQPFHPGVAAPIPMVPVPVAQAFRPATISRRAAPEAPPPFAAAEPELPAIYLIDALERPTDIAMKPIEPATFTIPALDGPAPLKVTDLPALPAASSSRDPKEKR